MSVGIVFPGQRPRGHIVLHQRLARHPAVVHTLAEAGEILFADSTALHWAHGLQAMAGDGAALVIGGVAVARAIIAGGLRPAAVAGIEFGALRAAVVSGMIALSDAIELARRGRTQALTVRPLRAPAIPYVGTIRGSGADADRRPSTARLSEIATRLRDLGITTTIEVVPGHTFTDLVERSFPDLSAIAVARAGLRAALRKTTEPLSAGRVSAVPVPPTPALHARSSPQST